MASAIFCEKPDVPMFRNPPIPRDISATPRPHLHLADQRRQFLVLALALLLTLVVNMWLLRRRFEPLERLLDTMERIDLSRPGRRVELDEHMAGSATDVQRLVAAFHRMLERLEGERRRSGELMLKAQEEERRRVARDLPDKANQAM